MDRKASMAVIINGKSGECAQSVGNQKNGAGKALSFSVQLPIILYTSDLVAVATTDRLTFPARPNAVDPRPAKTEWGGR